MKFLVAAAVFLSAAAAMAGQHQLAYIPASVTATTAVQTVTNGVANKGVVKGLHVVADNGTAVSEHVVTGTVSAVRSGQSRTLASFTVTTGTPYYTALTNHLFDESLSTTWTAGGTNAHAITYSVGLSLIYEE